jgi:hypothetical protein
MTNDRWDERPYLQRAGDALSQLANAWFTVGGMPDESLSGRSYRNTTLASRKGKKVKLRWRIVRLLAEALFWYRDRGKHTELDYWEDVYSSLKRAEFLGLIKE